MVAHIIGWRESVPIRKFEISGNNFCRVGLLFKYADDFKCIVSRKALHNGRREFVEKVEESEVIMLGGSSEDNEDAEAEAEAEADVLAFVKRGSILGYQDCRLSFYGTEAKEMGFVTYIDNFGRVWLSAETVQTRSTPRKGRV